MPSSQSTPQPRKGRLCILFIRHGETQDNIDKILQGQRDTLLTSKGQREAQAIADKLQDQHIDVIYHSPLTRMIQTIRPLVSTRQDIPTFSDVDLMGQSLGKLEGGSYDGIDMNNPRSADGRPGVERFDDFVKRLKDSLARIIGVEAGLVRSKDRTVVVATHGVGITSLLRALNAVPPYDNFNRKLAVRGPDAYEVRWTESDDVSRLIVERPGNLPFRDGVLDWTAISGEPFYIEYWGKEENAL